jgi:hypothetical protein
MEKTYRVLSPDGIDILPKTFASKKEARTALKEWKKRYKAQGGYSSNRGWIHYEDIEFECKIIEA